MVELSRPKVIKIDPRNPSLKIIQEAAEIIRHGGLVVFPTETVYGLAANALNRRAVRKIFELKGRPKNKPLIILISKKRDIRKVARDIPDITYTLTRKFWPGPLTLILKKKNNIPKEVTAGQETIAVRLSSHPVARSLVKKVGSPITAPSANISGHAPETTIKNIVKELGFKRGIRLILDAGETPIGKPSTILDLTKKPPIILRTGSITKKQLDKVIRIQ